MKNIFYLLCVLFLFGCSSDEDETDKRVETQKYAYQNDRGFYQVLDSRTEPFLVKYNKELDEGLNLEIIRAQGETVTRDSINTLSDLFATGHFFYYKDLHRVFSKKDIAAHYDDQSHSVVITKEHFYSYRQFAWELLIFPVIFFFVFFVSAKKFDLEVSVWSDNSYSFSDYKRGKGSLTLYIAERALAFWAALVVVALIVDTALPRMLADTLADLSSIFYVLATASFFIAYTFWIGSAASGRSIKPVLSFLTLCVTLMILWWLADLSIWLAIYTTLIPALLGLVIGMIKAVLRISRYAIAMKEARNLMDH